MAFGWLGIWRDDLQGIDNIPPDPWPPDETATLYPNLQHLTKLLNIAEEIEDDISRLLIDIEHVGRALESYDVAVGARATIDLDAMVSILRKLLPDHSEWDKKLHANFHQLYRMKTGLVQH